MPSWSDPAGTGPVPFRVLAVCHANHCRSPLMELVLAAESERRGLGWQVFSAGTDADEGIAMHSYVAKLLARRQIATAGWVSQRVRPDHLAAADLVLTAAEDQRDQLVALDPAVAERTFTLLQFAYLARFSRPGRRVAPEAYGSWMLDEASRLRNRVQPLPRAWRDVEDPMGRPPAYFKQCADVIDEAVTEIMTHAPEAQWEW